MKVKVLDREGKETSRQVELPDSLFAAEPNDHAIYLAVKQFLANQRQGTHKAKPRNEVTGSTRKIKRQKGTGGARAGDIKNPLFRGGGRIFGPEPRDYSFKLNKKVKDVARSSALAYKVKNNNLKVVEDLTLDKPKTKDFAGILKNWGAESKKTLFVVEGSNKNLLLSARNLPRTIVGGLDQLNTYEIMNADVLLISESAVNTINGESSK